MWNVFKNLIMSFLTGTVNTITSHYCAFTFILLVMLLQDSSFPYASVYYTHKKHGRHNNDSHCHLWNDSCWISHCVAWTKTITQLQTGSKLSRSIWNSQTFQAEPAIIRYYNSWLFHVSIHFMAECILLFVTWHSCLCFVGTNAQSSRWVSSCTY